MKVLRISDWPVRSKLLALGGIPLVGLLIFGITATRTLQVLRVNGPVYNQLADGRDLIADVLPPPSYIIEAYLTLFQAVAPAPSGPAETRRRLERVRELRQDFDARQRVWASKLPPGELRTALLADAGGAARELFAIEERDLVPALLDGDRARADLLLHGPMAVAYERHRRAVDRVVTLARAENEIEERDAEAVVFRRSVLLALTGALTLLLTVWAGARVALAILRPVRRLDAAIAAEARGDGFTHIDSRDGDELGRLSRSFDAMADAVTARTAELARANAELRVANQDLEGFVHSASHDLRTPLRAILGFSGILTEEYAAQLPDEARRLLTSIDENGRRMGQLIADLLAFARQNQTPLTRRPLVLEDVVHACFTELEGERRGRRVDLRLGALPACQADPSLIKQVFINLLSNAIKFTRPRDPALIEVGSLPGRPGESAVYYVKDNGVGFDMRYVDKVFMVFQRLHAQEEYEGTGVGLALVEKIVSRHGGRVWAEAIPGRGATFFLTLPSPPGAQATGTA